VHESRGFGGGSTVEVLEGINRAYCGLWSLEVEKNPVYEKRKIDYVHEQLSSSKWNWLVRKTRIFRKIFEFKILTPSSELFDHSFSIQNPTNSFEKSQRRLFRSLKNERSTGWFRTK
jgi:hypothetical protein